MGVIPKPAQPDNHDIVPGVDINVLVQNAGCVKGIRSVSYPIAPGCFSDGGGVRCLVLEPGGSQRVGEIFIVQIAPPLVFVTPCLSHAVGIVHGLHPAGVQDLLLPP